MGRFTAGILPCRALVARLCVVGRRWDPARLMLVCAAAATLAMPVRGGGDGSRVLLQYRYAPGDAFVVDRTVTAQYEHRRTAEGTDPVESSHTYTDRYRYRHVVNRVAADGRPQQVTRTYDLALSTDNVAGRAVVKSTRGLQGHTVVVKRSGGQPVVVRGPLDLNASDRREVDEALSDEFAAALADGAHQVGDAWPLPDWAASAFYVNSKSKGTCRFQEMVRHAGKSCARIVVTGEVVAVDYRGEQVRLQLSGYLLWSVDLQRTLAFSLDAVTLSEFTTTQGATVFRETSTGRMSLRQVCRWTALAGKPVRNP